MTTTIEDEKRPTIQLVDIIPAPGLGDPISSISAVKYEAKSESAKDMVRDTHEIVKSGECIVRCNHADDGCIDGRCVNELAYPDGNKFITKYVDDNQGNERAKVAGGGLLTSLAMYKAVGEDIVSPEEDIAYIARDFARQGVQCGAHTAGSHGSEVLDKTGCGANDKFDEIMNVAITHRKDISDVSSVLIRPSGNGFDADLLGSGLDKWSEILEVRGYFDGSNGVSRLDAIRDGILSAQATMLGNEKASVLKNLGGGHNEVLLVVNYAKGHTFSQTKLREMLMERHPEVADPDELPQVFVLDMWRVEELAHAVANITPKDGTERTEDEKQARYLTALHAGVAYQIATYATLTDGSLPVAVFAESNP